MANTTGQDVLPFRGMTVRDSLIPLRSLTWTLIIGLSVTSGVWCLSNPQWTLLSARSDGDFYVSHFIVGFMLGMRKRPVFRVFMAFILGILFGIGVWATGTYVGGYPCFLFSRMLTAMRLDGVASSAQVCRVLAIPPTIGILCALCEIHRTSHLLSQLKRGLAGGMAASAMLCVLFFVAYSIGCFSSQSMPFVHTYPLQTGCLAVAMFYGPISGICIGKALSSELQDGSRAQNNQKMNGSNEKDRSSANAGDLPSHPLP